MKSGELLNYAISKKTEPCFQDVRWSFYLIPGFPLFLIHSNLGLLHTYIYMSSIYLYIYVIYLSIYIYIYVIYLSIYTYMSSIYLYIYICHLSICLSIYLSIYLFIYLYILCYIYIYVIYIMLYIYLSICISMEYLQLDLHMDILGLPSTIPQQISHRLDTAWWLRRVRDAAVEPVARNVWVF